MESPERLKAYFVYRLYWWFLGIRIGRASMVFSCLSVLALFSRNISTQLPDVFYFLVPNVMWRRVFLVYSRESGRSALGTYFDGDPNLWGYHWHKAQ